LSRPLAAAERRVFSIGELLTGLRHLLEDRVGRLWVVGEVSNLFRAASGHHYFTLKDQRAQVRAVLFRGTARRLSFELEEGLEVLAYAEPAIYEPRGDLQLLVHAVEPRGQGALQLAFEQLRRRLEGEGLFDPARKRGLPAFPACVGIVTSPVGAALHDVLQVSAQRSPATRLLIAPTRVQGEGAEREIAASLRALGGRDEVEVILLVRGGGSLEDLWPFNSELVARAIADSAPPVVSGVGHEVDVTIADLVADARAPTPSVAAALALPDRTAASGRLRESWRRLASAARAQRLRRASSLGRVHDRLRVLTPRARLAARRERLAGAWRTLARAARQRPERARARLAQAVARLDSLSPLAVLGRGYALVRQAGTGAIVRDARDVAPGDALAIRVARAEIEAEVRGARSREPAADGRLDRS
jgi:exodeoxyribonuclease VII large subunit